MTMIKIARILLLISVTWINRTTVVAESLQQFLTNSPNLYFGGTNNLDYLTWADTRNSSYAASIFLPSTSMHEEGAAVHWKIHNGSIYLGIAVRATGWLGFGLAEAGGMQGSDVFLFQTLSPSQVQDAHILDERVPILDDCQDWKLIAWQNIISDHSFLMVEVRRLLNTNDTQDREIYQDDSSLVPAHRILAAWGNEGQAGYHGAHRASGAVRWYRFGQDVWTSFRDKMKQVSDGSVFLLANNYTLDNFQSTAYIDFCLTWTDVIQQGVPPNLAATLLQPQVVGIEPVIDEVGRPYVHHFTVYASVTESCDPTLQELIYVWGPGEFPFQLPDNVGFPFGGLQGYKAFQLQIHYNNPNLDSGVVDNSGIRMYYSRRERTYEMGVTQLGDPYLSLNYGIAVSNGTTEHTFNCPSTCTLAALNQAVTVVHEYLHMHQTGLVMQNNLIRDGKVVHVGQVDFWNYQQQAGFLVPNKAPFRVLPGDSWQTKCVYRSTGTTLFGQASQEEMCIAFLFYYPRQKLFKVLPWVCGYNWILANTPFDQCFETHSVRSLDSDTELSRRFGGAPADGATCLNPDSGTAPTPAPAGPLSCSITNKCDSLAGRAFWMQRKVPPRPCQDECVPASRVALRKLTGYRCGRCSDS